MAKNFKKIMVFFYRSSHAGPSKTDDGCTRREYRERTIEEDWNTMNGAKTQVMLADKTTDELATKPQDLNIKPHIAPIQDELLSIQQYFSHGKTAHLI